MKKIALWGASGSIGKNTLEVFRQHPDYFTLVAFSVHRNVAFALEIIKEFRPEYVVVTDKNSYQIMLENASDLGVELLFGQDALVNLSGHLNADLVSMPWWGKPVCGPVLRHCKMACTWPSRIRSLW